jgi:hypothetical protein
MPGEHVILFIDTNAFLQMRDLKDIPWREQFPGAKTLDLMVAPRIVDELDEHKTSTNERRRNRARSAIKLIVEAARAKEHALTIRSEPVEVRLVVYPGGKFDWDAYPILDPTSTDDQLVAAALAFGNGALVFSHDAGPRIRALLSGIAAPEPNNSWLLPPDKTDDQRKITQLERDLDRAMNTKPHIIAEFEGIDEATRELKLYIPVVKRLDPSYVEALSDEHFTAHPIRTLKPAHRNMTYELGGGYSSGAVERYEEKYRDFKTEVRRYFANLHEKVSQQGRVISVPYFIHNDSGTAAAGLRVEFHLHGEGHIIPGRKAAQLIVGSIAPPEPPEPPKSAWDLRHLHRTDFLIPKAPDPVKFRWYDRPGISGTSSAMQCEDFRATRKDWDNALVLITGDIPFSTLLKMQVSAQNSPAPVDLNAKIIVEEREVEWLDDVVLDLLPEEIATSIKELFSQIRRASRGGAGPHPRDLK